MYWPMTAPAAGKLWPTYACTQLAEGPVRASWFQATTGMPFCAAAHTALLTALLVMCNAIPATLREMPDWISEISVWLLLLAYWTLTFRPVDASTAFTALSAGFHAASGAV